jgi:hypothetical protein
MLKKIFKSRLSQRELAILNECCRQVKDSMEKQDKLSPLSPEITQIKDDIGEIMKKLEAQL